MTTSAQHGELERWAAEPLDETDVAVLAQIAAHLTATDPPPPGLVESIQFEITLAELYADVDRLQGELAPTAGVRAEPEQTRTVTFSGPDVSVMLTVTETSAALARVDGWVAPGSLWTIEARCSADPAKSRSVCTDRNGRFVIPDLPMGLVQFLLRKEAGAKPVLITRPMHL